MQGAIETPLGTLVATASPAGITRIAFDDGEIQVGNRRGANPEVASEPARRPVLDVGPKDPSVEPRPEATARLLEQLEVELAAYFEGKLTRFTVPVDLTAAGTPFQRRVWAGLLEIPFGSLVSYQQLAASIGSPRAVRAVGAANGANPAAIVVPCHRVVQYDGSLGGYAGGTWRKQRLLEIEGCCLPWGT